MRNRQVFSFPEPLMEDATEVKSCSDAINCATRGHGPVLLSRCLGAPPSVTPVPSLIPFIRNDCEKTLAWRWILMFLWTRRQPGCLLHHGEPLISKKLWRPVTPMLGCCPLISRRLYILSCFSFANMRVEISNALHVLPLTLVRIELAQC